MPNDLSLSISDGRDRQGDVEQATIFALADSFVMVDALPAPEAIKNRRFFILPFGWNENHDRLTYCFFSCVPKEPLCGLVPTLRNDCVVTVFDNGSEPQKLLVTFAQRAFVLAAFNKIGGLSGKHIQSLQGTSVG